MFASREMLGAFFQILFKASLPFGTIHVDSRTYGTYDYTGYAQKKLWFNCISCDLPQILSTCPSLLLLLLRHFFFH